MPATPMKNLIYGAALPFLAPSPRGQMTHAVQGEIRTLAEYERILCRHHVFGASLLLKDDHRQSMVHTSTRRPAHHADDRTLYRVASITKTATALVTLMLADQGLLTLDTPVGSILPEAGNEPALQGVTVRHLLCHRSGLRDTAAYQAALDKGESWQRVLRAEDVQGSKPGESFSYCNFGFGLLGCAIESVTNKSVAAVFDELLFRPAGMRASLDASTLDESLIMPITRVLPYRAGTDVTVTRLGRKPLAAPQPLLHFGHTAGAMYTDAPSLSRMLTLIACHGALDGRQLVSEAAIHEMTTLHGYSGPKDKPIRRYGLGLVLLENPSVSSRRLLGHQGFAYGCVDGAFVEEGTGRQVILLNGGSSERREGKLGLINRDTLRWALNREMPLWT
ncbi:MAG: beta-lactamase family protein [Clostridia bacterium]|nr:beta-lactamase family protein [Clostridia bacterium]